MYVSTNVYSELTSWASRSNENVEICTRGRFIRSNVYSTTSMLPMIRKLRHGLSLPLCNGKFSSIVFVRSLRKNFLRLEKPSTSVLNVNAFRTLEIKQNRKLTANCTYVLLLLVLNGNNFPISIRFYFCSTFFTIQIHRPAGKIIVQLRVATLWI